MGATRFTTVNKREEGARELGNGRRGSHFCALPPAFLPAVIFPAPLHFL